MLKIETVLPPRGSTNTESTHKTSGSTGEKFSLELETERKRLGRTTDSPHADSPRNVRSESKHDKETTAPQLKRFRKDAKAGTEQSEADARQIVPPGEMNVDGIPCPIDLSRLPIPEETASDAACRLGAVHFPEGASDVPHGESVFEDSEPKAGAGNVVPEGQPLLGPVIAGVPNEASREHPHVSHSAIQNVETINPEDDAAQLGEHASVQGSASDEATDAAFQAATEGTKIEETPAAAIDRSKRDSRPHINNQDLGQEPSPLVSRTEMQNDGAGRQFSESYGGFPGQNGSEGFGNTQRQAESDSDVPRAGADGPSIESRSSLSGAFEAQGTRGVERSDAFHSMMSEQASSARASNLQDQIERADVMSQLVEKARLFRWENNSELHISLRPETLGHVTLRASIVDRTLVATIAADSDKVRHLLELELPSLHRTLREDGLLAKVVVAQGNDLNFNNPGGGQPQSQLHQENPNFRTTSGDPNPWLSEASAAAEADPGVLPEPADARYLSRSIHLIA